MSTPNPELSVMSVAGPSSSRKRTSEQLDPSTKNSIDAQRQPPEDEGQDQPRARKRVATGELDAMDERIDGNKDVDRDSGKAVDVTREEPEPGDMQRERASEPSTATTTTMGEIHSQEQRLPSKVPAISPVTSSSNQKTSYETTKVAVEGAVRRGANRWTVKDLKKAYPIISAPKERTKAFEKLWLETSEGLRAKMINQADAIIEHYEVKPALDRLELAVEEARVRKARILRGEEGVYVADIWRPDLSPQALTAAYNLPRYDAVYTRLREEYIQLFKDCERLAGEVDGKKKRMDEIKDQVIQANEQLKETADKLENVPGDGIKMWMGDAASNDQASRTMA
ncbi:hypothetical protein FFLO_07081 [Filobasidium floriforme]|uniref:Uncharacterized protein n=1 Tax=Filobasidium floriforme TaxID=5210 RepID=A0A8K0JDL4_9TREE|nr:hypothetical protein FFLO_07081 [Filobasidium floriforme]